VVLALALQFESPTTALQKLLHSKTTIFKMFKIEIEIFKTFKPQQDKKKAPSYAIESSKHPLNLVRLSL
jgi:hypothetical protein